MAWFKMCDVSDVELYKSPEGLIEKWNPQAGLVLGLNQFPKEPGTKVL